MDDQRFDRITRMLGTAPTRRGALRLLLGGALGGLLGGRPRAGRAICGTPDDPCPLPCDDVVCEPANACQTSTCNQANGQCVDRNVTNGTPCATGICCDGACKTNTDANCGCAGVACGICKQCSSAGACVNKTSRASCPSDGNSCTQDVCDGNGNCIHPSLVDGQACESDGMSCTQDVCLAGTCQHLTPTCPPSDNPCRTRATDPSSRCCVETSLANGTSCPDGTCQEGQCVAPPACQTGFKRCNGTCVNLNTDEKNCGRCGKRCKRGETCRRGRCQ